MKIAPSLLQEISKALQNTSETPALDAQVLLANITQKPRAWLLAHPELTTLSPEENKKLEEALQKLKNNVPLPYVIGHWAFYGMDFIVSPDVLIPRPETEELVEYALTWIHEKKAKSALDVGTGPGCIPVSLARHAPDLSLVALEQSSPALSIARENAVRHKLAKRINFIQSDLFANLPPQRFDLITANLPYIPTETLPTLDVYTREPTLALDGGADGLTLIRRFLAHAPRYIASKGLILLEIDSSHGKKALAAAQESFPTTQTALQQDLSGRDRFIRIQLPDK